MSAPSVVIVSTLALSQSATEMVDASRITEIERLQGGGHRPGGSGDFTLYVLTPMAILLCLIILGRRMLS